MPLVTQVLVRKAALRRRVGLRRRAAEAAGAAPPVPGIEADTLGIELFAELLEALVFAGFGRPRNRVGGLGGRYCLLNRTTPDGYLLTLSAADPMLLAALGRCVRGRFHATTTEDAAAERETRIQAIAREMEEPVTKVRTSVESALAGGRTLDDIEAAVGIFPPGMSRELAESRRLLDLDAAAEAVLDLVRAGLADGVHPGPERYPGWDSVEDRGLETMVRARRPGGEGAVEIRLFDQASTHRRGALTAFFRPAVAVWRLAHPHLASAIGLGRSAAEDRVFTVTEVPGGTPLSALVAEGAAPAAAEVRSILRQAAEGLAVLHELNLVHGDLRPGNLHREATGRVRLSGFGRIETAGVVRGVGREDDPGLRAPETRRRGPACPRSDVYALAATVLRVAGRSLEEMPDGLRPVLARMLSPDPAERPANARAVLRWL